MDVDAGSAADFPGDGAESAVAALLEHGVQGRAVALHFGVGRLAGCLVCDAGEGGCVGEGDDQDVAGEVEGGERFSGGEGSLGGCEVAFVANGRDEMGCNVGVGEAEEALLRPWGRGSGALARPAVIFFNAGEAVVGLTLRGKDFPFDLDGGQRGCSSANGDGKGWRGLGI